MYGHVRENQLVVKSSTQSSPSVTGAKQIVGICCLIAHQEKEEPGYSPSP